MVGVLQVGSKERACLPKPYLPSVLKSLCCAPSFASTCPCTGGWSLLPVLLADGGVDGVADGVVDGVAGAVELCGGVAL